MEEDHTKVQRPKSLDERMKEEGFERVTTLTRGPRGALTIPSSVVPKELVQFGVIRYDSGPYTELRIISDRENNFPGTYALYGKR